MSEGIEAKSGLGAEIRCESCVVNGQPIKTGGSR